MLEEIIGRPIFDQDDKHGEGAQLQLEKPAELVEDVDFGGRSIHDFLDDTDERHDAGSLDSYGDSALSAMECEYVYSYNVANILILNVGFR